MGLGPSASRPSGHNTKRSATAGRFFICRINPRGAGTVLKTDWLPMAAGVRVLCSAPSKQTPKGVQATADNALVVAHFAELSQLVENLFCNQVVRGSSPRFSTKADDTGKGSRAGRGNCVPR